MVYPALLPLMRTPRLPVVDWTDVPRRFKWTRPFRRKTKSCFCACAITFQLASTKFLTLSRYKVKVVILGVLYWQRNSRMLMKKCQQHCWYRPVVLEMGVTAFAAFREISDFCSEVAENCTLLACYWYWYIDIFVNCNWFRTPWQ